MVAPDKRRELCFLVDWTEGLMHTEYVFYARKSKSVTDRTAGSPPVAGGRIA
jgi:hypothetical protein